MDLLARREHSGRELRDKLARRFSSAEQIEVEILRLSEEGLQSDARFAQSFVRQRIGRGHGPLRIRQELKQRGIADAQINEAFACEPTDWVTLAEEVLRRRFGEGGAEDIKDRARRQRFLQYRGFSYEHFAAALD